MGGFFMEKQQWQEINKRKTRQVQRSSLKRSLSILLSKQKKEEAHVYGCCV
jgi:hypothetical protein